MRPDLFVLNVGEDDRGLAGAVAALTDVAMRRFRARTPGRLVDPLVDLTRVGLVPDLYLAPVTHGRSSAARRRRSARRPGRGGSEIGDHSPSPVSRRSDRSAPLRR